MTTFPDLRTALLHRLASDVAAYLETAETGRMHAAGEVDGYCCWQFYGWPGVTYAHRLCGPGPWGVPCAHAHHFTEIILAT